MQQPSAQGIASLFRGNPAPLQQRIQQEQQGKPGLPPDLQKLLALNIVTNEKDAMAKQQAMDQLAKMQGPQGQPPTVMQTVQEQARQKMEAQAVQAQQQQQGLQALMQQVKSPQIPEGTPQPEAQPQGIDELPVEFGLAGGGIVAFQEGKSVPRIQDEVPISDEERERLELELLTRIIGEEARNPPPPKRPPMEITESDITGIPGMEPSDLRARALREAAGPQPDNRALLNAAEVRGARQNATADLEREKAAIRPKYETPYDRMNRKNRGEMTDAERADAAAREPRVINLPKGTSTQEAELVRMQNPDANVVVEGQGSLLREMSDRYNKNIEEGKKSLGRAFTYSSDVEAMKKRQQPPSAQPTAASYSNEGRGAAQAQAPYSNEGRTGARPYTPTPKPVSDLKALAEADARKQRSARPPAPAAQAAPPAAPVAPSAGIAPPQSEADRILNERLMQDPTVAAANKEMMHQSRIGAPDTTQRDAMIKQLQEERARQVGPQDSFGQLMEYLGQIAATPRGMSSFEAGASGARGVRGLEEQRAQKRFDLGSKIIEQEQGKIDASRQYAKEVYGVGEREYDQIFKAQYEAAKQISSNDMEARKLAKQETLKLMELKQEADLSRERMQNNLSVANINQTRERNDQDRINKITSLKQQARRLEATDPKGAAELMAQATDLEMAVGRGSGTAGVGAGRNKIMERRQTMTELEKIIKDEGMVYSEADKAGAAKEYRRLALMNVQEGEGGGGGAFAVTAGGKTYTFPTQEAANKFKAEAGVK